jgi:hypothetical protein
MDAETEAAPVGGGTPIRRRLITAALWAVGVALQFAAPLLRDRVPLSDDLFITSMLAPWWLFLQVCLLAGLLKLLRRRSEVWSGGVRIAFAAGAAVILMLLQPDLLTQVFASGNVPLSENLARVALLWSTPLAFYVVPAAIVVGSWLRRERPFSALRALGWGLVSIGVLNFPYILWLTHLWRVYYQPQGADSVASLRESSEALASLLVSAPATRLKRHPVTLAFSGTRPTSVLDSTR